MSYYRYEKDMGQQIEEVLKVARARLASADLEQELAQAAVRDIEGYYGRHLFGESGLCEHEVEFLDEKDRTRRMVVCKGYYGALEYPAVVKELILEGKVYLASGKLSKEPWCVPARSILRDLGIAAKAS